MPSDLPPEERAEALRLIRQWTAAIGSGSDDADRALDALLAAGWTPPAQPDAIAADGLVPCECCGYRVKVDAIVDNPTWAKISPTGDEGGYLCANCMVERLVPLLGWQAVALSDAHGLDVILAAEARGIEAAADVIKRRWEGYVEEHGSYDHTTGVTEFPGDGDEWVGDMQEVEEEIRALAPSIPKEARHAD